MLIVNYYFMKIIKHFYILLGIGVLLIVALSGFYGYSIWAASHFNCENLGEKNCQSRSGCAAIYNQDFEKCVEVPLEVRQKILSSYQACINTGGQWLKTKFGEYCDCATIYPPMEFVTTEGCIVK